MVKMCGTETFASSRLQVQPLKKLTTREHSAKLAGRFVCLALGAKDETNDASDGDTSPESGAVSTHTLTRKGSAQKRLPADLIAPVAS